MLTTEQLRKIMPQLPEAKRTALFPFLTAAITEFEIDRPARTAAFLAQLAHESGQFRFMEEIWGPTDAQNRYEPPGDLAQRLGNTEAGDGRRFKGRGPIQVTGRANYRTFGDLLRVDLVADPARAANPDMAFRIAALYWVKRGLNELADKATGDAFRQITRRINGGFNGLEDRQRFYESAKAVLGVTAPPAAGPASFELEAVSEDEPMFDRGLEGFRTAPARPAKRRTRAKKSVRKRTARRSSAKKTAAKKTAKKSAKKSARGRVAGTSSRKKTAKKRSRARKATAKARTKRSSRR
jgi:putative chitinase